MGQTQRIAMSFAFLTLDERLAGPPPADDDVFLDVLANSVGGRT